MMCPGCGKKSKGICKDCKPPTELKIKYITIILCSCQKYFYMNKWKSYTNLKTLVKKILELKIKKTIVLSDIMDIPVNPGINKQIEAVFKVDDEEFILPINIKVTYCNTCAKKQGDYFEGVLQLRNISKPILDFLNSNMKKSDIYISEKTKQPNGIDMQFSDKKKMTRLIRDLQKQHGGIIKLSPRLHTKDKQTSKKIYRLNIFYGAPDYKKGDVIKINDKLIHVTEVKKTISGINLISRKRVKIDLANKEYKILIPVTAIVTKTHPQLEIMDPATFQSVLVINSKKVKIGEKVRVVNDQGLFYVL